MTMFKELIIILIISIALMQSLLILAMYKASRKADNNINKIRNK